jgi:hypothetical protein
VITVLVDHNIEGQADLLERTLMTEGWIDLTVIRIVTFADVSLPVETSDRGVWEFAQEHRMVLLTANRNQDDEESLQQAILEQNQSTSYPVVTIATPKRIVERDYRTRCATALAEICMEIERYFGTGRLYIP